MEPSLLVYQVSSLTNHAFMTTHSCSTWMTGLKVWVSLKSLPMCIKSTTTMERCSYQSILTNRLLGTSRPHQWPTSNVASVLLAYFLLMTVFLGRCSTPLLQTWHPSWRRHRGIPAPTIVLLSCPNCRPGLQRQAMFWKGIPTAIFRSSHPPNWLYACWQCHSIQLQQLLLFRPGWWPYTIGQHQDQMIAALSLALTIVQGIWAIFEMRWVLVYQSLESLLMIQLVLDGMGLLGSLVSQCIFYVLTIACLHVFNNTKSEWQQCYYLLSIGLHLHNVVLVVDHGSSGLGQNCYVCVDFCV